MKQTQSAIKFLMAQYRAIFKHAYLKGLVSAAVLTAGISVGANANAANEKTDFVPADTTVEVTSEALLQVKVGATATSPSGTTTAFTGTINIKSGAAGNGVDTGNFFVAGADEGKFNDGSLVGTINISKDAGLAILGGQVAESGSITVNLDTLSSNGTLNITAGSGSATLNASTLDLNSGSVMTLTSLGSSGTTVSGSSWDLDNATITLLGTGDAAATVKGKLEAGSVGTINVSGSNDVIDYYTTTGKATLNINVSDNASGSITFEQATEDGKTEQLSLTDSDLTLGAKGKLSIISGTVSLDGESSVSFEKGSILSVNDGSTLNLGSTEIVASGSATLAVTDAANVKLNGSDVLNKALTDGLNIFISGSSGKIAKADISGSLITNLVAEGNAGLTVSTSGEVTVSDTLTISDIEVGSLSGTTSKIKAKNLSFSGTSGSGYAINAGTFTVTDALTTDKTLTITAATDKATKLELGSSVSGEVVLGSGALGIVNGGVSTTVLGQSSITVGDSTGKGTLQVSGTTASGTSSLTFNEGSKLNLVNGNVVVSGSAASSLTLNKGTLSYTGKKASGIVVNELATLNVYGDDLTSAFGTENGKFGLVVSGNTTPAKAIANVSGDLTLNAAQFKDESDVGTAGGLFVGTSGEMTVDGTLTIVSKDGEDSVGEQVGTISATNLTFSGDKTTVTGGTFKVTEALNADNGVVFEGSTIEFGTQINADVTLNSGSGDITDNVSTLAEGKTIALTKTGSVGAGAGNLTITADKKAASLTLEEGSILDLQSGSITVTGTNASLDASKGTFTASGSQTVTVKATSGASFTVNSEDLAAPVSGGHFALYLEKGNLHAIGDLELDSTKFVAGNATPAVGIAVSGNSIFDVDGKLTLTSTDANINLSNVSGSVLANSLVLDTQSAESGSIISGNGSANTNLVAKSGLESTNDLSLSNITLTLGEAANSTGAINSNLKVESGAAANVLGTWTSSKNLTLSASNSTVNVGNSNVAGSLTVAGLVTSSGSSLNVANGSSLTSTTIDAGGNITVNGNMTVNGQAPAGEVAEGDVGKDGYYGFSNSGDTINVNGGRFTIGSTAADNGLLATWDSGENATNDNYVRDNFGKYKLTNNGVLSIQFTSGSGSVFTIEQLKQMKDELIDGSSGGVITGGVFNIGGGTISDYESVINSGSVTWENYQAVIKDTNVVYDELVDVKVTGVDGNFMGAIGSVQLASSDSNASLQVTGDTNLIGADASGNFVSNAANQTAGVNASAGTTVALWGNGQVNKVTLAAGESSEDKTVLSLTQGFGASDSDTFTVQVAGVQATTASGSIADNTEVQIAKNVTVNFTDNVTVDSLVAEGKVNAASHAVKTNNAETAEGVEVVASDFTVNEFANLNGNVTVTNNMSITSTKTEAEGETTTPVNAIVNGEVQVGKNLTATQTTFAKKVDVKNNLTATNSSFGSDVVVTKALDANGSTFVGNVKAETLNATSSTFAADTTVSTVAANFAGSNEVNSVFVAEKTVKFGDGATASNTTVTNQFASEAIEFVAGSNTELNVHGGVVVTKSLTGVAGATIHVGSDDPSNDVTGALEVDGVTNLAGLTVKVDPSYEKKTATATFKSMSNNTISGDILVGKNSAVGIGVNTAGLNGVIAQFQNNGSFVDPINDKGEYGAMFYLDKPISIGSGVGITLTAGTEDELNQVLAGTVVGSSFSNSFKSDAIYLGEGTALAVNIDNAKENGAYITFKPSTVTPTAESDGEGTTPEPTPTTNKGYVVGNGGDIVLYGDNYQKTYQLFEDGVEIKDLDGNATKITVVSANGLLEGFLDEDSLGSVNMGLNKDKASVFLANASAPVQATVMDYLGFEEVDLTPIEPPVDGGDNTTEGEAGTDGDATAPEAKVAATQPITTEQNYFLSRMVLGGTAGDAETVARLGVYGGATQAALVAGSSTSDAVASRMGMGAQTGAISFADNGQGAGLWISPIYKNHDSDGFGAQGLSYGADLDITGLALGGDVTMANGIRVGAAFNLGSGDSSGQGSAAGVSNDFDYYGFSIYGGYTMGNISIVGDISYTVVDNDVTGNTAIEKVSATMDSTNMSFGLTGAYAMDLNGLSVTPHAGLRFTQIDMDDYTVKGSADIAHYSADSANIFSIPVGVTFAKEITTGSWTVKPALDLTLTANMGDDSVDGTVTWADMTNFNTKVETEIVDSFTYGATLGVAAKTGNFSFGFGVNYTGASSADEYGVNANARFVF